ncbi:hypothetical protein C2869_05255 [Saccharobesus litoralis]|uniref:RecBCD enzyme subunit RecB n=1 Tax=Saccharobesus litoralis TaxID=2172099 RepID=A0A2S0VNU6_9ALTE|nr:UvrD-helicase domain-containing protein [Saccharobesus litoralis]AWB65884.1 hypothetical protein C2869_05255 [Saccharobesus litoralis]
MTSSPLAYLQVESLPLSGRHLIEASAGTGKTYNITRLYLRLLLEKQLTVEEILVVTFTQAATEELKGRIGKELRAALSHWQKPVSELEPVFAKLVQTVPEQEAKARIELALLHLDEAAIYTIHGFCSKALAEYNLLAGLSFDMQLATDTRKMLIQVIEDQYRRINLEPQTLQLLLEMAPDAQRFLAKFQRLISDNSPIENNSPTTVIDDAIARQQTTYQTLLDNQALIEQELVNGVKDQDKHQAAWRELLAYFANSTNLTELKTSLDRQSVASLPPLSKAIKDFMHGRRFTRKADDIKQNLKACFDLVKEFEAKVIKRLGDDICTAQKNQLAARLILAIRQQMADNKRQQGVMDFNDLILHLAHSLALQPEPNSLPKTQQNPQQSSQRVQDADNTFAQLLNRQYPAILVDEFQDTDPEQYQIFNAIQVANESHLLLMIGDPKQAIYKFRGGDIFTYLAAREQANYQWFMDTNYRSAQSMVTAYNRVFYGQTLPHNYQQDNGQQDNGQKNNAQKENEQQDNISGTDKVFGYDIQYTPVKAHHQDLFIQCPQTNGLDSSIESPTQPSSNAALHLVCFDDGQQKTETKNQSYRQVMAQWFANEIANLLGRQESPAAQMIEGQHTQVVREQDIAILVRDFGEAQDMQQALREKGLSAVYLSNRENIYQTAEAGFWLRCIQGILHLERDSEFVAALATPLLGVSDQMLYTLQHDETLWESWRERLVELRRLWLNRSFIAMAFKILHEYCQIGQSAGAKSRDRQITNLMHLVELIQAQSQQTANPQQLVDWLQRQVTDPDLNSEAELRLESEDNLIRIVTLHGSKGLEYPIVFVPFATRAKAQVNMAYYQYFQSQAQRSVFYLGNDGNIIQQAQQEQNAEDVRLLYVALTRPVFRCYIGVCQFNGYDSSPLGLTLGLNKQDDLFAAVAQLANSCDAICTTSVNSDELLELSSSSEVKQQESQPVVLQAATFTGQIEKDWMLHSFSALTKNAHHQHVDETSSVIDVKPEDEHIIPADLPAPEPEAPTDIKTCFSFIKGANAGLLLHEILELMDFSQPDFTAAWQLLEATLAEADRPDQAGFIAWLQDILATPLSSVVQQTELLSDEVFCLADLSATQILREVAFYFPMHKLNSQQLLAVLAHHRGKPVDLQLFNQQLQGMMNGIIDLVIEWQGKYYVADYKSNHLGGSYADYHYAAMLQSVESSYYDLQYLIYSLALHRYLRQRLDDYDPEQHFGGAIYLYLRGLAAPQKAQYCPSDFTGVYGTRISVQMLDWLDATFNGEEIPELQHNPADQNVAEIRQGDQI